MNYRWVIMCLFCTLQIQSPLSQANLYSLQDKLSSIYQLPQQIVILLMLSCPLVFVIVSLPVNYLIDRFPISLSIIIAQCLQITGNGLRMAINHSSYLMVIGQILVAIANCIYGQVVPKISARWFPPDDRLLATSCMTSTYMLGNSLGFYLNSLILTSTTDITLQKQQIVQLFLYSFIISIALFILFIPLFKEHPDQPICYVELQDKIEFRNELYQLVNNKDYLYLLVFFFIELGCYITISTFLIKILTSFDPVMKVSQANKYGSLMMIIVTIGKITGGVLFKYSYGFRKTLLIVSSVKYIAFFLLLLSLHYDYAILLSLTLFSCVLQFYFATGLEFSCELGYPAGEAISTGGIMTLGCIYSFICSQIVIKIVNHQFYFILFFIGNFMVALVCMIRIEERLKRREYEQKGYNQKEMEFVQM